MLLSAEDAIAHHYNGVGPCGETWLMGNEKPGGAGVDARAQHLHDFFAGGGIERAGRLIREQYLARANECTGDCGPLRLTA